MPDRGGHPGPGGSGGEEGIQVGGGDRLEDVEGLLEVVGVVVGGGILHFALRLRGWDHPHLSYCYSTLEKREGRG